MEVSGVTGGSNEMLDIQMRDMDKANESFVELEVRAMNFFWKPPGVMIV
jgi:hypothetical protein